MQQQHRSGDLSGVIAVLGNRLRSRLIGRQVGGAALLVGHRPETVEGAGGLLQAHVMALVGRRVALLEEGLDIGPVAARTGIVVAVVQPALHFRGTGLVAGGEGVCPPVVELLVQPVDQILVEGGGALRQVHQHIASGLLFLQHPIVEGLALVGHATGVNLEAGMILVQASHQRLGDPVAAIIFIGVHLADEQGRFALWAFLV